MPLLDRLQRNFATWSVPIACAVLGSGFGISRAILACDAPVSISNVDEVAVNIDSTEAPAHCDENGHRLLADIDGDGFVDAYDLVLFLADYGSSGPLAGDINDDGHVDAADLTVLISYFSS